MRTLLLIALTSGLILSPLAFAPPYPTWWTTRGVINPSANPDDQAAINQGQLKNFARAACEEMEAVLAGGAGVEIRTLVATWESPGATTDDYLPVNQGQLKNLLAAFYARTEEVRAQVAPGWLPVAPPWEQGALTADAHALANMGQVKYAFAGLEGDHALRSLTGLSGADPVQAGLRFGLGWLADTDGDGVSDVEELVAGTDPTIQGDAGTLPNGQSLRIFTPLRH
jgi:hypothetical protein